MPPERFLTGVPMEGVLTLYRETRSRAKENTSLHTMKPLFETGLFQYLLSMEFSLMFMFGTSPVPFLSAGM